MTKAREHAEKAEQKALDNERRINELLNEKLVLSNRAEKAEALLEMAKKEKSQFEGDKLVNQRMAEESKKTIESLGDNLSSLRTELEHTKHQRDEALSKLSDIEVAYKTIGLEVGRKDRDL